MAEAVLVVSIGPWRRVGQTEENEVSEREATQGVKKTAQIAWEE